MKTKLTVRQISVSDAVKDMLLTRLDRFDKFFSAQTKAEVKLSEKHNKKILEITIYANSTIFRAEVEEDTFQNALDQAIDIIERQIRRHKTKLQKQMKSGALSDLIALPEESEAEAVPGEIRQKTFQLNPMTVEEAILQMELLGHSFFIFRNSEEDRIEVVYARHDETYGLLIPQE